ncbi:MAG: hypothetical protein PHH57_05355 [Candidatus Omnitrophica bacterium]|nr:hypothetical protein [Candidatus Omnitrophota bacterium]
MRCLKTNIIKFLAVALVFLILFNVFEFIKSFFSAIDLPKGRIVFNSQLHGNSELYTMNINGTGLERLTKYSLFGPTFNTLITDARASFSPDGRQIVFDSDRDDKNPRLKKTRLPGWRLTTSLSSKHSIYIVDFESKAMIRLTYGTASAYNPVFSPDGKSISFYTIPSEKDLFYRNIKIINSDGTREMTLAEGKKVARSSKFSPDGRKIYFVFHGDIYMAHVYNKSILTRLTNFNSGDALGVVSAAGPLFVNDFAISPDGEKIILAVTDKSYQRIIFYSMFEDGKRIEQINVLNNEGRSGSLSGVFNMRYSPDGRVIVFVARVGERGLYGLDENGDIRLISKLNRIDSEVADLEGGNFVFSPDNKHVLFVASFPCGLFNDPYIWVKSICHNILLYLNYYVFKRVGGIYDNKYLCIMNIKTGRFKKIARMPISSSVGREFIHWE